MKTSAKSALAFLAVSTGVVGFWATLSPTSFYNDFPGPARAWVAVDGPYNEHLVRDVGELNLALLALTIAALVTASTLVVRIAAISHLVYGVPHLVYHVRHRGVLAASDQVMVLIMLSAYVALAWLLAGIRET